MSANVHRWHLTKGQQAMATALAYPEGTKYKRGGSILSSGKNEDDAPSAGHISKARFVLRNCLDKKESRPFREKKGRQFTSKSANIIQKPVEIF